MKHRTDRCHNRDIKTLGKCSKPEAKRKVLKVHWWQVRYCPGPICACLDSRFGWDAETSSRMESSTCCFLTGLEVLAKVSKQCGAGGELEQGPMPVSAPSSSQMLIQPGHVLGERLGQKDTEPLWGGRCCALCLGCLSGIQGIRLEFLREPLYPPWVVASLVQRESEFSKVRHWEPK